MNSHEYGLVKRAARDMILDSLVDFKEPLDMASPRDMARVYDEVMALPGEMEKSAAAAQPKIDPVVTATLEKSAELALLGRVAAQSYANHLMGGMHKIALDLESLKARITGRTPQFREQELGLVPQEVDVREKSQAQGAGEAIRQIQLREMEQRQELAQDLRRQQLADQFERRRREEDQYKTLTRGRPWGKTKALVGGGLAGAALGRLAGAPGMGGVGAMAGLAGHLLSGPGRGTVEVERARHTPMSMVTDVNP